MLDLVQVPDRRSNAMLGAGDARARDTAALDVDIIAVAHLARAFERISGRTRATDVFVRD
jgi:hypothetical protein